MKKTIKVLTLTTMALSSIPASASDKVQGNTLGRFQSPKGHTEVCVALNKMPGGEYSKGDSEKEAKFCAIDLYAGNAAMCPKTWSTSAGIMIYDATAKGITAAQYENSECDGKEGHKKLAKFKNTMNQSGTSGTFSTSSLLYYHFSRYFDTSVSVPVAVFRTIDKDVVYDRVATKAKPLGTMNDAAWDWMKKITQKPEAYNPVSEVFTEDRRQIYGVLLKDGGERYRSEFNGVRTGESKKEDQQENFQKTAPFLALTIEKPVAQAAVEGEALARKNRQVNTELGPDKVPFPQMVFWMKELTEITILDYIFSQQDRVGNIDYDWVWTYVDGKGEVKKAKVAEEEEDLPRTKMSKIKVPAEIAQYNPILLQRSSIGDNDAGGRSYANKTKKYEMLQTIRHMNNETYAKLIHLAKDFKAQGPLFNYVKTTFGLDEKYFNQAVTQTLEAAEILSATCQSGKMIFDLKPKKAFFGEIKPEAVDCLNPSLK